MVWSYTFKSNEMKIHYGVKMVGSGYISKGLRSMVGPSVLCSNGSVPIPIYRCSEKSIGTLLARGGSGNVRFGTKAAAVDFHARLVSGEQPLEGRIIYI